MNEAGGIRRSNLTKEQKREAEAAIYGLSSSNMTQTGFTHEEIERMRAMVAAHDQANGGGKIKEFDLNNPPKQPYVHQEFPRLMYHHGRRKTQTAHNATEMQEALEAGWRKEPFPAEVADEPELDEADQQEAARLDKIARKPKKVSE